MINGTRHRLQAEIARQTRLGEDIARLQTQISGGVRILRPSDDPGAAAQVAEIARNQADEATWSANIKTAVALSDRADTTLTSLTAIVARANELMVRAANDVLSDENRATVAIELRSIADEIVSLSAARDARGEALFADGAPLAIPVGAGLAVAPVASRQAVFDQVAVGAGTQSLEAIVAAAAAAITTADPAARRAAIDASLTATEAAATHVATVRGQQGVRAGRLDNLGESLAASKLQIAEERGELEGTDITEAVASLESKRLSLTAAQAVFARLNQTGLFDLLR